MELGSHGELDTSSRVVNLGVAVHHACEPGGDLARYQHFHAPRAYIVQPIRGFSRPGAQHCPDAFIFERESSVINLSCFSPACNAFTCSYFLIRPAFHVNAGFHCDF